MGFITPNEKWKFVRFPHGVINLMENFGNIKNV